MIMSIDPSQFIKTSELDKRFNIGKNTRVNRLAMLGLTPDRLVKEGRYYLLTAEQLDLFTEFDRYILETGSTDGYPRLLSSYSDSMVNPVAEDSEIFEDVDMDNNEKIGKLATTAERELDTTTGRAASFLGVTGEFTETLSSHSKVNNLLTEHLVENAQRRATAMLMAESVLADRYINNPDLLSSELRAQIDSIEFAKIDPKELAASLVATVRRATAA
jgi:hypothetical protein